MVTTPTILRVRVHLFHDVEALLVVFRRYIMGNERNLGRIAGMANDIVLEENKENKAQNSEKRMGKVHGKWL